MTAERQRPPSGAEKQLLKGLELPKGEVQDRTELASDGAYWKSIYPLFHICDELSAAPQAAAFDAPELGKLADDLDNRGYFLAEHAIDGSLIGPILGCVEAVKKAGWPPVFAYVYDELWTVWRLARIVQMVTAGLGPGYRWIPHGWCHYVDALVGASGWPPHVDGNLPNRMSIWIPLTDATLDNGCVYAIPRNLNTAGVGERRALRAASNLQMRELLQRSRALPARAGSLLGWHFRVLHWGSVCQVASGPRVSLVMEFIGARERALESELPLYDGQGRLPSLPERLYAIGRAVVHYKRFELRMRRYVELGRGLMRKHAPIAERRRGAVSSPRGRPR